MEVNIIGAGLAGCEAAYQLLIRDVKVNLYEMKPNKFSEAHKNPNFAELVCSNSLKSNDIKTAGGLLKEELRKLNSLLICEADKTKVVAGSALAVDREKFSQNVTEKLKNFKNLNIISEEITTIPLNFPTIIATGPLTSQNLCENLFKFIGQENLYFFDAIAPIISFSSINMDEAFFADRYGVGTGDYINCPFNKEKYSIFYNALINAEIVKLKDFENSKVFEGCMPIEVLAKRGFDAMRFGPLKPVGIKDKNGRMPYAVVQLRHETNLDDYYNLVGFQTNLTFGEQNKVFKLIPGLENAEFLRYGTMHKNIYINAPKTINKYFQLKNNPNIFIAGQLSGVEGYVESIASGMVAGLNMYNLIKDKPLIDFPLDTLIGALPNYITNCSSINFQPMCANMGLINISGINGNKAEKNALLANNALNSIEKIAKAINVC